MAAGARSRYYDAILKILNNDLKPELRSPRALYAFDMVRTQLARLAAVNDYAPYLPENLSALRAEAATPADHTTTAESWHRQLLEEGRLLDEIETATDTRRMVPEASGQESNAALPESVSIAAVERYLQSRLDPDTHVKTLRVLSGGRSKQTILLDMVDGSGRARELVIRRDLLTTNPTGGTVPEEFAVLEALYSRGIPVPRPVLCEPDSGVMGSPFIVVGKVAGTLAGHLFDPPSEAAVLDSARVLGRLHALPVADLAPTMRPRSRVRPDAQGVRSIIVDLESQWSAQSRARSVTLDFVFKWLLDNANAVQPLSAVVHGDYSYHNILFQDQRLTAVLDWELVRVGHPAEDLGYIRPAVLNRISWDAFMAAYRSAGGPAIAPLDLLFYTLLEKIRLMVMLFKVRGFVEEGLSDDIELVNAVIFMIPRLIHQMSTEIRQFLGTGPALSSARSPPATGAKGESERAVLPTPKRA
ncbi:MAG TPA: phosphotransferase family protein [Steroidobacteraceae bacterium]|nr:phosphotransferase family protein [Steroidobacteraceae bacterium]